jgi:hypothetical protein
MPITCKCFGACDGDPKWRDDRTGFPCNVCGGSGKYTSYSQADMAEADAKAFEVKKKSAIARAEKRRRVA